MAVFQFQGCREFCFDRFGIVLILSRIKPFQAISCLPKTQEVSPVGFERTTSALTTELRGLALKGPEEGN
eukprot:6468199-Amphidinium_carterae.1